MAIIFKSKYDRLGVMGWFIYIPLLIVFFWLNEHDKSRCQLLLIAFLPLLKGIVWSISQIQESINLKNRKTNDPKRYVPHHERREIADLNIYRAYLIVFIVVLGLLFYNASKDFTTFADLFSLANSIFE